MKQKQKYKNKIIYNNYQFYENDILTKSIEKQSIEGYSLLESKGMFLNILKFCYTNTKMTKSYIIFRKHLDKEIDDNIEEMKAGTYKIIFQNKLYIIFEKTSNESNGKNLEMMEKKQNTLLGVPIKKSIAHISIMFIIYIFSLTFKIFLIERGDLYFNLLNLGISLALIINFLFYFIGDLHDVIVGKGIFIDNKMYFSSRTKFKDALFKIGDVFKFSLLLVSVSITGLILLNIKDEVLYMNVLQMWVIYLIVGYTSRIQFQRSYISLLLVGTFLIVYGRFGYN